MLSQADKTELKELLLLMASTNERESKIYFGSSTTEADTERNKKRQAMQAENAIKYRRWAECL